MVFIPTARQAWGGVPFRDDHRPDPKDQILHLESLSSGVTAAMSGFAPYETKDALDEDLEPANGTYVRVWNDSDPQNNRVWRKTGGSGTGSWVAATEFDATNILLQHTGGTANAPEYSTPIAVSATPGAVIYIIPFTVANTGAMTVTVNDTTRPLVSALSGSPMVAGAVGVDRKAFMIDDGTNFVLFIDGDATPNRIAAEIAAAAAQSYAAGLNMPTVTPSDAGKVLAVNAGGTGFGVFGNATQYATLADLESDPRPLATALLVHVVERTAGAGRRSGGVWARHSSEPDVPSSAKTQSADNTWWALDASDGVRPEQLGAIAKPVIEAETRTWFNALVTKPRREHLREMDRMVTLLKITGLWAKIGAFWVLASTSAADAYINVKNPGTGDLSAVTAMTFTAGRGFDISTGELTTSGYAFSDVPGYALDDAHVGIFLREDSTLDDSIAFGANDGDNDVYIYPRRTTESLRVGVRLNANGNANLAYSGRTDHVMGVRRNGTEVEIFINGQDYAPVASTSTGVPTTDMNLGRVLSTHTPAGVCSFLHAGSQLDAYEARALWWILREYQANVEGVINQGEIVQAADLDATVAVATNTTAIKAAHTLAEANHVTLQYGPESYLVDDTIRAGEGARVRGVLGKTRIRADDGMANNKAVFVVGAVGSITRSVSIRDLTVDYNLARDSFDSGGAGDDTDGNAFVVVNVQDSVIEDIETWSAHKHCFDVISNSYNRSGTAGTYNPREHLKTKNCTFNRITAIGAGDDGITFHGVEDFKYDDLLGMFTRATFSPGNANGVEFDDYCRGWQGGRIRCLFVHNVEIKGHDDALAAERGQMAMIEMQHSARLLFRHINHHPGDPDAPDGVTPIAKMDVQVGMVRIIDPLTVSVGTGVDAKPLFIYAVDGLQFGMIHARAGKGARQVSGANTEVINAIWGATGIMYGDVFVSGFTSVDDGVSVGDTATGAHMFNSLVIENSGTDKAFFSGDDANLRVAIGNYRITNEITGSDGVFGYSGRIVAGQGFVDGYTTSLSLSN